MKRFLQVFLWIVGIVFAVLLLAAVTLLLLNYRQSPPTVSSQSQLLAPSRTLTVAAAICNIGGLYPEDDHPAPEGGF